MPKIVCIGAGRLATQLMPALENADAEVVQIYNRTLAAAQNLSSRLKKADTTDDPSQIMTNADLYFITLSDDAVTPVARQIDFLENKHSVFLHCSGMLGLDALPFERRGAFYPLQTFSAHHQVDWHSTPVLITADQIEIRAQLMALARRISNAVYEVSDADKSVLHLSAVYANNFTNHMLTLAEKICRQHHVDFDMLKPLVEETFRKALVNGPAKSQTGPAIRGDQQTMEKHLKLLNGSPGLQEVYRVITDSIRRT